MFQVLYDSRGCIRRYDNVQDILREFFAMRMELYHQRKAYLEGILEAESSRLNNQARFIMEKIEGKVVIGEFSLHHHWFLSIYFDVKANHFLLYKMILFIQTDGRQTHFVDNKLMKTELCSRYLFSCDNHSLLALIPTFRE